MQPNIFWANPSNINKVRAGTQTALTLITTTIIHLIKLNRGLKNSILSYLMFEQGQSPILCKPVTFPPFRQKVAANGGFKDVKS